MTVPRIIDLTVADSSHAFAAISLFGGSNSVRMPYFAGE